jgi:hypothetical protein
MDISRRVTIAGSLLAEYNRLKGDPPEVSVEDAQDLVSDILHWLHVEAGVSETAIDEEILRMARCNFLRETDEVAGEIPHNAYDRPKKLPGTKPPRKHSHPQEEEG